MTGDYLFSVCIPLTQGAHALVDSDDYDLVTRFKWHLHLGQYARACPKYRQARVYMHRLIMNAGAGELVDHIDGNGLDNRKRNMRLANRAENNRNRIGGKSKKSPFKGVAYQAGRGTKHWRAAITVNYEVFYLGIFRTEVEAALAYNAAAIAMHGRFARPNEIDQHEMLAMARPQEGRGRSMQEARAK